MQQQIMLMFRFLMTDGTFELWINATFETNMSTQTVMSGVTISAFGTFEEAIVR